MLGMILNIESVLRDAYFKAIILYISLSIQLERHNRYPTNHLTDKSVIYTFFTMSGRHPEIKRHDIDIPGIGPGSS
jgi:hypothetical protein